LVEPFGQVRIQGTRGERLMGGRQVGASGAGGRGLEAAAQAEAGLLGGSQREPGSSCGVQLRAGRAGARGPRWGL
jgi:hypothetical protein